MLGVTGQHEHVTAEVGEQGHDGVEGGRVDGVERRLHVGQLGRAVAGDRLIAGQLADALGGRAQLAGEVALDRRLQRTEAVEAELAGQADDGGRAGPAAASARSATVPKPTSCGCSRTTWATRRSAVVSWGPALRTRSSTSVSAMARQ